MLCLIPQRCHCYRLSMNILRSHYYVIPWLQEKYNLTFHFHLPESNPGRLFMHQLYLPLQSRFGSFIVGSLLAVRLVQSSNNQTKTYQKYVYFALILIYMILMKQNSTLIIPPRIIYKLLMSSTRQIYAICQSFLLFTCLCPSTHPYHSKFIRTFLSLPIWIPISKLSYLVYLIHWGIAFELILAGPLKFVQSYPITIATLISLPVVLIVCQLISSVWFVLVDQPIQRIFKFYFLSQRKSA